MVLQYRLRLYLIAFLLIGAFGGLLYRLWNVQVTSHTEYAKQLTSLAKTRTVTVRVPGVRGEIKDRNGNTLVSNRLEYQLVLNLRAIAEDYDPAEHGRFDEKGKPEMPVVYRKPPGGIGEPRKVKNIGVIVDETVIAPLAELGLEVAFPNKERAHDQLINHYDMTFPAGLVPYTLPVTLTYEQFAMLSERSLEIPGLEPKAAPVREYNYGSLAAHVLGYVRKADRGKDIDDLKAQARGSGPEAEEARMWLRSDHIYEPDPFGVLAVEKSMDPYLKGRAGYRELLIDQKFAYVGDRQNVPPKQGYDVRLTLDLRAQYILEMALRKANNGRGVGRGAAVLMDPNTGAVLAMATVPSYDPNRFIPSISAEDYRQYREDKAKPLTNRAVGGYATGSVFKIAVALAGAMKGLENFRTHCGGAVTYNGLRIKCMGHHQRIGLQRAIMKSCNSFFYRYGNEAGIENIVRMSGMMGLNQPFGLPIFEGHTEIPNLETADPGTIWKGARTAMISIGQSDIKTSPLQMAQLASVIASGGKCHQVRLIERIEDGKGSIVEEFAPKLLYDLTEHGVKPSAIERIRKGMYDVVNTAGGTARRARLQTVKVAGKTSTAQKYTGSGTHAWFIAFAPYEKPQYALSVFVEDGDSGGKVAAPVAKRILQELFRGSVPAQFQRLAEAPGNFDKHSEITYDGDLWTVPEGERDTADTAVPIDESAMNESRGAESDDKPQSSEIIARANGIPRGGLRKR